jgi:hypothetical protein
MKETTDPKEIVNYHQGSIRDRGKFLLEDAEQK